MKKFALLLIVLAVGCSACKKDNERVKDTTYQPDVNPAKFSNSTVFTNPFFPFEDGKTYVFEGQTEDGLEHVEVKRTTKTKVVMGITCVVINDKVWLDGKLIEETDDWYAQDNDGNVWYFGEDVDNYNLDGSLKNHAGAWEAGVDGAQPGIIMLADPKVGMKYREEYYFNEAEDEAEVVEVGVSVTIPYGTFDNCIKTRNWTELEPDVLENKFYAPGIGVIKEVNVSDKEEIALIDIKNE
jgi:hypothetical protein